MSLLLALLIAQVAAPGVLIQDEGTAKGAATTLNCVGAGITCAVAGAKATLTVTSGGGGGTSTSAGATGVVQTSDGGGGFAVYTGSTCGAGLYATSTSALGALGCAQVAYSQVSGTPAAYVLPTSSAAMLGGSKVGAGLAIDGTGVLSATYSYTLPTSSASTLGGVKVGSGLSIDGAGVLSSAAVYTLPSSTASGLGGVVSPTCSAGYHYASVSNGTLVCTADASGPGGGANIVDVAVPFDATSGLAAPVVVTGQAWVTSSSKIVCEWANTGTDPNQSDYVYLVAGLHLAVGSLVAATGWTVYAYSDTGATGVLHISCTGA